VKQCKDIVCFHKLQGMVPASVTGADFDGTAYLQIQADHGSPAIAHFMHWKWVVTVGAEKKGNGACDIIHILKFLVETAVNLAKVDIPRFFKDLGPKMDRGEIIDLNIRVHQRLLASRAFHQNPDPTIHNMRPFLSSPSGAGIL
jgi:hypothetical protein